MKKGLKIALIILTIILLLTAIALIVLKIAIPNTSKKEWKIKEVYLDPNDVKAEIAIEPSWEEKTITEKFYYVKYLNTTYDTSRSTKISSDKIGDKLGTVTLTGNDIYTDKRYNIEATLYKIKDFPEKCVIAVQFEGDDDYYVYINAYYRPTTLGDFINDLKLKDIVSFGTVYYSYTYEDEKGEKQYEKIDFYNVDNQAIWNMLFNDLSLENIYDDNGMYTGEYFTSEVSISVNIPLFGIENKSVSLTDNGYLITNIFETGKGFYIGVDKVQAFINYIIKNYDGYKTIYVDKNGNEIMEEDRVKEDNTLNEQIVMIENTEN